MIPARQNVSFSTAGGVLVLPAATVESFDTT
jgi:hypothetical protein